MAQHETKKFQRKTVLVKRSLQLKYIGMVFLSVLVASMIVGGDIYYSLSRVLLTECPSASDHVAQFNSVLLVKTSLYLGQSVAGGDLTHRVSLRTGDELMELQEEFNGMVSALQTLVQKDRNLAQRLSERVDEIAKKVPDDAARRELKDLKVELAHLTKSFKV